MYFWKDIMTEKITVVDRQHRNVEPIMVAFERRRSSVVD